MKYKIKKGGPTFKKLVLVRKEIERCNDVAIELVKKHGGMKYKPITGMVAGGIEGVQFDKGKKPAFWTVDKQTELCMPGDRVPEQVLEFKELPMVNSEQFNSTIGYKPEQFGTDYIWAFGCTWGTTVVLVDIDERSQYKPLKDMQEILVSEFVKLKNKINEKSGRGSK